MTNAITSYPYHFKLGGLVGNMRVATVAGQAIQDAPFALSQSPYPLVILSPGFAMGGTSYAWLAEHLGSHGFVVISPEHHEGIDPGMNGLWKAAITRPQEVLTIFDYVDEQVQTGGSLEGLLDPELVAVIGHSYGGYTSLVAAGARFDFQAFRALCETSEEAENIGGLLCDTHLPHEADMAELAGLDSIPTGLWPAWADQRVDAIVPLAGDAYFFDQAGLAPIRVPVMAMGGTRDSGTPFMWGTHPTYEYVSSPKKVKIAFKDAEHMIFAGSCQSVTILADMALKQFCSDPVWDRNRAHGLVNHFTTAFLLAELKQEPDAAALLAPKAIDFPDIDYQAQGY